MAAGRATALARHPSNPDLVLAGSADGGVARSTDAGETWKPVEAGLPVMTIRSLVADAAAPGTFFLGGAAGIFRSTDSGATWTSVLPADLEVMVLATHAARPGLIYAGMRAHPNVDARLPGRIVRSTDSGETWSTVSAGLTGSELRGITVSPRDPARLWVAFADAGIFSSRDSGETWARVPLTGFDNVGLSGLALSPAAPGRVIASSGQRILRSFDEGRSWEPTVGASKVVDLTGVVADPRDATRLYATAWNDPFLKSTDGGLSWSSSSRGLPRGMLSAIAIDPTAPSTIYAGTSTGPVAVFKSTNGGKSWLPTSLEGKRSPDLAIDPVTPSILYAAAHGHGVIRSTDAGASWGNQSWGLDTYSGTVRVSPSNPSTVYVLSGYSRIYRSTDSAGFWEMKGRPSDGNRLALDPDDDSTLYVGGENGVFESTDGGSSWQVAGIGLPLGVEMTDLVVDPTHRSILYAALAGRGLWRWDRSASRAFVPVATRGPGPGGAFFTTDLTVANTGSTDTWFDVKALAADAGGLPGPERRFPLAAGASTTLVDVLGRSLELTEGVAALRVTSPTRALRVSSQTITSAFGGTLGQGVPAARPEDLIVYGKPRSILGIREDAQFRTNLALVNVGVNWLEAFVTLFDGKGFPRSGGQVSLPPLGMTQLDRVVRAFGVPDDIPNGRVVIATYSGGTLAAVATSIDNVTNDRRTLLPLLVGGTNRQWILPAVARVAGPDGVLYGTSVTVYGHDYDDRQYTLKYLPTETDGRAGPEATFQLAPRKSAVYEDVVRSVFGFESGFGALRLSWHANDDSFAMGAFLQTTTYRFGGTLGQSVPAFSPTDLIRPGRKQSILAIREDAAARTNLILANAVEIPVEVDVDLVSEDGQTIASGTYRLPPLGMRQISRVVRDLGIGDDLTGGRLILSIATPDGAFAAYASLIDNVTHDPRTLLPR
ncbi:MAG: hypothetical protein JNK60_18095 [Acidobacteria bacterium]|nr:hypothetical protein [Acidobacteriota bacterium]